MNWIVENWDNVLAVYGGLVVLATAIVKLTPTPKDDSVLDKVLAVLDYFSTALRKNA